MRADLYLVERGTAESRTLARRLIEAGVVWVDGRPVEKPAQEIGPGEHTLRVEESRETRYVGRGGLKLEAALDTFPVSAAGGVFADIGASTGGFTDCLLSRGAARVYCIDAGHGQLHPRIRADSRVRCAEGCNARLLCRDTLVSIEPSGHNPDGSPFTGITDGAVMDVSFISQTLILPALTGIVRQGGFLISLIKPQFECGAAALSRRGVVTAEADRRAAVDRVCAGAMACGFACRGLIPSPIRGGDGNREYLAYFVRIGEAAANTDGGY